MMRTVIGIREEPKLVEEMTTKELRENITLKKKRYRMARENYEFEYAPMILEEIKALIQELNRRKSKAKQEDKQNVQHKNKLSKGHGKNV